MKRKEVLFQLGDMVRVDFRKDRLARGASPYKVLAKINNNAYKIDLLVNEFGTSNTFNVVDFMTYNGEDLHKSRLTPFLRTSLVLYRLYP
jgi:hypothetical protein